MVDLLYMFSSILCAGRRRRHAQLRWLIIEQKLLDELKMRALILCFDSFSFKSRLRTCGDFTIGLYPFPNPPQCITLGTVPLERDLWWHTFLISVICHYCVSTNIFTKWVMCVWHTSFLIAFSNMSLLKYFYIIGLLIILFPQLPSQRSELTL